jgi:hypothetical protein
VRLAWAVARFVLVVSLGLLVLAAATSGPERRFPILGALLLVGAVATFEGLRWLRAIAPADATPVAPLASRGTGPVQPRRPVQLLELEALVESATINGRAARVRLGPRYRDVARDMLARQRGIDIDFEPDRAAEALGPDGWALASAPLGRVPDPTDPGLPLERIEHAIDGLETL